MDQTALFTDGSIYAINSGARHRGAGEWEWWLTTTRYDQALESAVEEYLDGGLCVGPREAAHKICQATGAMFG